jgi:hypothetical protein
MITSELKKFAKKIISIEKNINQEAKIYLSPILGHPKSKPLVQFYRSDEAFRTLVSLNHFISFFSNRTGLDLNFYVQVFSREGKILGKFTQQIKNNGCIQFFLDEYIKNIDEFGLFSISFDLNPKFREDIKYLGQLNGQYMTMYIPRDEYSAPQMIHSHKIFQGLRPYHVVHKRPANHVENLLNLELLKIYTVNSCGSDLNHSIHVLDAETGKFLHKVSSSICGYGANCFTLDGNKLLNESDSGKVSFIYEYDRSVDHKKPIFFRKFKSGIWTANHT